MEGRNNSSFIQRGRCDLCDAKIPVYFDIAISIAPAAYPIRFSPLLHVKTREILTLPRISTPKQKQPPMTSQIPLRAKLRPLRTHLIPAALSIPPKTPPRPFTTHPLPPPPPLTLHLTHNPPVSRKMTELSFAKSFLSTLDNRPIKLPADYAADLKTLELKGPVCAIPAIFPVPLFPLLPPPLPALLSSQLSSPTA